jgi:2-succinyl-5-enolpyruvyl-6-hydroxy-3-cyclohexene-1-carboxylate synthase
MRDCHSGQTIDQLKLYGNYPNWQTELAVPSPEIGMLSYLRQTIAHAWERALFPVPGTVHLNIPFRDPLTPIPQFDTNTLKAQFQPEDFFAHLPLSHSPLPLIPRGDPTIPTPHSLLPTPHQEWQQCDKGIIIAGSAQPQQPQEYCEAIAQLSKALNWPVLAEGLSPVRNYADLNPYLISTYDLILRNRQLAQQLKPEIVIHLGELPISKELRTWLDNTQARRWVIDPSHHNLDPLHGKTTHLRTTIEQLTSLIPSLTKGGLEEVTSAYLDQWCAAEAKVRSGVDQKMSTISQLFESKAAWLLSQSLPPKTPLFIANSMPVRDVEFFWKPNNFGIRPFFNRGANGIDGTLSTALGIAHQNQSSVMLTGDLALLHDTNGFLLNNKFVGHLTIVLINNNGGGIFEMLPISKFDPPFEEFFATPQNINFAQLCVTYGVEHHLIQSWEQLRQLLNPLPTDGIRVLELQTNRKADARWRQENLVKFAADIESD